MSQNDGSSGHVKAAIIAGICTIIAACIGGGFLLINTLLEKQTVTTPSKSDTPQTFTRAQIDEILGVGNWFCFPDRQDGVGVINLPDGFVVRYPLSNVDKGAKYNVGQTVPGGGSATAWLQGILPGDQCPLR